MEKLTLKQQEILNFIKQYIHKHSYAPSVREIAHGVKLKAPSTVHVHIGNLIEKGYLRRDRTNHKMLILVNDKKAAPTISWNIPYIKTLNEREIIDIPAFLECSHNNLFAVLANSNDLKDEGIFTGDLVIAKEDIKYNDGDIVVAIVSNNIIIRKYYHDKRFIRLETSNEFETPMVLKEANIIGKVIYNIHKTMKN